MEHLYIVGDSHVSVFGGRDAVLPKWPEVTPSIMPALHPIHLGPVTAHNWNNESSSTGGRKLFSNFIAGLDNRRFHIILSAGEIDCRAHLLKKANESHCPVSVSVEATVGRYLEFIERMRGEGLRISVLSPPGTSFMEKKNSNFPFHGSERERNAVTRIFSAMLGTACEKNQIPFLDQFSFTVDSSDITQRAFFWDGVHLGASALPRLVSEIRASLGLHLRIPLLWHLRERVRGFKKNFRRTL
jgi:hypothetical protein